MTIKEKKTLIETLVYIAINDIRRMNEKQNFKINYNTKREK